jgi:hypothetical protein
MLFFKQGEVGYLTVSLAKIKLPYKFGGEFWATGMCQDSRNKKG